MIPLSPAAFKVAQTSKRNLETRYPGALVVSRDGTVRPIERIDVLGPWGGGALRKILSALTDAWAIEVHFGPSRKMDLEEFKDLVTQYLRYDAERGEPYLPQDEPLEEVLRKVRAAKSCDDVFRVIHVPPPEDALDVL
jgi:hypothetical protein